MEKWLIAEERDALERPLLLYKDGRVVEIGDTFTDADGKVVTVTGVGPDVKAFLDPTLFQTGGRDPGGDLPNRPFPLSAEQVRQARLFTYAYLKLGEALTGHGSLTASTFKETLIASTGGFVWDTDGQFVGIYKKQPFIGRGTQKFRVGRGGGFILPEQRALVREITQKQLLAQLGLDLPLARFNRFAPDYLIEKPDYDMTYRNRNYGFVYSYDVYLTAEEQAALFGQDNVLVLSGDAPHPTDAEIATYKRVFRRITRDDMERIEADGMLTLEAELPILRICFDEGRNRPR